MCVKNIYFLISVVFVVTTKIFNNENFPIYGTIELIQ